MPTYTILQDVALDGTPLEQVAGGYNAQLLTDSSADGTGSTA